MRLTFFSKLLITVIVLGAIGAGLWSKREAVRGIFGPGAGGATGAAGSGGSAGPSAPTPKGPHIVVGVNDFGGAYPGLVANDGTRAGPGSCFAKAGLDVEIALIRGSKERLEAFDAGQVDIMLLTLDYVANLYADYHKKGVELQAFFFVDWSRGNLGIVAKPQIHTLEALAKARIATTRNTPTHYFLLTLADRTNLGAKDLETLKSNLVFAKKTPLAGEMFQRGEVDAVAIWEPHLSQAAQKGGGKLLVSTATATNLVADVLFARKQFLDQRADAMPAFLRCWLEGAQKIHQAPAATVPLIAQAFAQSQEETTRLLGKIKLGSFADNRAFFGLETEASPAAQLLAEAAQIWKREGVIAELPDGKAVFRTKFLEQLSPEFKDERVVEDFRFQPTKASGGALFTKSMSIYFATGSAELDANARRIIDQFAAQTVGVFQNAYVRVEGNTDNVGGRPKNQSLSKERAQAVVSYLTSKHRFVADRFVAVGNGPDRPVSDNKTPQGRELNRRTDFRIVPNW